MAELGRRVGLSASLLSLIENNKLVPTLTTLVRIAMLFDVGLDYFFAERSDAHSFVVSRPSDRTRFSGTPNSPCPSFEFECLAHAVLDRRLQPYLVEFPLRAKHDVTEHSHPGVEFVVTAPLAP